MATIALSQLLGEKLWSPQLGRAGREIRLGCAGNPANKIQIARIMIESSY